jgi:predicted ATPase
LANARPLLLMLEDLHWSDPESLYLLRYLARQLMDHRILIVATYRDVEVMREHHLFQLLPILVREADAKRIDLRPLTEADVSNLVGDRYHLSRSDLTRLGAYLQEHGEGNPLFTRELLRTLEEQGHLRQETSSWVLGDVRNVPVPRLLRQVIERRLERLNDEQRALLEVAAVIGQEVPLDLWQAVSEATDEKLIVTMEQAVAAHVVDEATHHQSVGFTHALIREALYTGIVLPRRNKLHQAIAEALLRDPAPDTDAVAYHLDQAGDERAIDWLITAGEQASYSGIMRNVRSTVGGCSTGPRVSSGSQIWSAESRFSK